MTTKPGRQIRPFAASFPAVVLVSFFVHAVGLGHAAAQLADGKIDVSKARVEGIVVNEAGKPVAGAQVRVLRAGTEGTPARATSTADGAFRLVLDDASARYQTFVASTDDGARQGIVSLQDTYLEPIVRIRLELKAARSLAVRVSDGQKRPLPAASVGVFDHSTLLASGETDAQGKISFRLPADANLWQVVALKPGAGFDYFENYRARPGGTSLPPPAEVKLVLEGAQIVRVRAADATGKPVPNTGFVPWTIQRKGRLAYVNLSGGAGLPFVQAVTDDKGLAVFDWLPHDLHEGVTFLNRSMEFHQPDAPHFDPPNGARELTSRLLRNVPISGKLTLPDGRAAGGILLQVEGRGATSHYFRGVVRTKADGAFTLKVYPDQSYLVAVTDTVWAAPTYWNIIVREGEPLTGFVFQFDKGTLIQGKVTVGKDERPAAAQTITLIQRGPPNPAEEGGGRRERGELVRWATTDKDGKYAIRVSRGEFEFWGPGEQRQALKVQAEKTITKDFHLPRLPRGPLTGVVLAPNGNPVPGAMVKGESIGALSHAGFETITDDKGRFHTERWRDKMQLRASNPDGTLTASLAISEDDAEVTILLAPAGK